VEQQNLSIDTWMQQLKLQVANGDERSFKSIFDYYAPKIKKFAFAIVKTQDAATEITDAVFVKIWKSREQLPNIDNLRVYLYTAAKNTALNYLAKMANQNLTQPFDYIHIQLQQDACPDEIMINKEMLAKINAAINQLPPKCKMIFKLVREDGLKYKEVAAVLNVSVKTVDAQMVIAIKKISENLKLHMDFHFLEQKRKKYFFFF
jgi:RNA polymerase sigma-70 factor (family 1)